MKYFHGNSKVNQFFEGWYFKHQNSKVSISFIPGVVMDENSCATAFIQIITAKKSHFITYPISKFFADANTLFIKIDKNVFTKQGIHIDIDEKDANGEQVRLKGYFFYGKTSPLPYSIMGPLQALCLPCKHGIISMRHSVNGVMSYNDTVIKMDDGIGYMETDYGSSFPNDYFWTQYNGKEKKQPQIFASIATIPLCKKLILGTVAIINYKNKQYRLATYLGAKVLIIRESLAIIQQKKYILVIHMKHHKPQSLKAPVEGTMSRLIREDLVCPIRYEFYRGREKIFDIITQRGSFEYVIQKP